MQLEQWLEHQIEHGYAPNGYPVDMTYDYEQGRRSAFMAVQQFVLNNPPQPASQSDERLIAVQEGLRAIVLQGDEVSSRLASDILADWASATTTSQSDELAGTAVSRDEADPNGYGAGTSIEQQTGPDNCSVSNVGEGGSTPPPGASQSDEALIPLALAAFNGGLVTVSDPKNPRGFTIKYDPEEAMHCVVNLIFEREFSVLSDEVVTAHEVIAELIPAMHQYRGDLLHPVAPDSRERRLEMLSALIEKATRK